MTWMAEYEIEEALRLTAYQELPNLRRGAEILSRLKDWTNSHSDGWPYWQKPANAANKLMDLLHQAQLYRGDAQDATEAEVNKTLSPIKAFLTKQGVDHALILNDPPPPPPSPVEVTVYLPGDAEGPDLFGVIYADEDPAVENAMENDGVAWKIKALLIPNSAVKVWEREDDDEEDEEA